MATRGVLCGVRVDDVARRCLGVWLYCKLAAKSARRAVRLFVLCVLSSRSAKNPLNFTPVNFTVALGAAWLVVVQR